MNTELDLTDIATKKRVYDVMYAFRCIIDAFLYKGIDPVRWDQELDLEHYAKEVIRKSNEKVQEI